VLHAFVLIRTARGRVTEVAEALADLRGVSEVYSVTGRFDLVAVLRVRTADDMADLVTGPLAHVEGVERTETLTAFRAYSRHDLEAAFSLGLE
jgi:DNA-binding Lrp family transcriptional regulator